MNKQLIKKMIKETKDVLKETVLSYMLGDVDFDHVTLLSSQLRDLESML